MRCECMGCKDPHPDPEQLITDDPSTPGADVPSSRDSNGWKIASDDWPRGICPDCSFEVQGMWGLFFFRGWSFFVDHRNLAVCYVTTNEIQILETGAFVNSSVLPSATVDTPVWAP